MTPKELQQLRISHCKAWSFQELSIQRSLVIQALQRFGKQVAVCLADDWVCDVLHTWRSPFVNPLPQYRFTDTPYAAEWRTRPDPEDKRLISDIRAKEEELFSLAQQFNLNSAMLYIRQKAAFACLMVVETNRALYSN